MADGRALEGDALLHGRVAEGVGAPAELHAALQVVVGVGGGRTWRGTIGGFLILL